MIYDYTELDSIPNIFCVLLHSCHDVKSEITVFSFFIIVNMIVLYLMNNAIKQ